VKKIAVGQSHSYLLKILREACPQHPAIERMDQDVHKSTGSPVGETPSSEYHNLSSCLAGDLSIICFRAKSANTPVSWS
jgi:hypothetical protein